MIIIMMIRRLTYSVKILLKTLVYDQIALKMKGILSCALCMMSYMEGVIPVEHLLALWWKH